MSLPVSDRTRSLIARSLPLVQQRRDLLVERIEESLVEGKDDPFGQAEVTAMMMTDLLLREAKRLVESGAFGPLSDVSPEHRALAITGRHYSRFGDALMPTLRGLLGPTLPREVASAWCDTFWAIIHEAQEASGERAMARQVG